MARKKRNKGCTYRISVYFSALVEDTCSRPEHNTNPSNHGRSSDFVLRPFIVPE